MALRVAFQQTKDCEWCGQSFGRKRGAMTDAAWEKKRFCCRKHYHDWQRAQGPRGSDGEIRECAAPHCERTFWAYRSQPFCRDTRCREKREQQSARERIKREGTADDLERFDAACRERELEILINEQRFDEVSGDKAWAGSKNAFVLGFDDLLSFRQSGASAGEDALDPLSVIEFDEHEPFKARAPRRQGGHSYLPARRPREAVSA